MDKKQSEQYWALQEEKYDYAINWAGPITGFLLIILVALVTVFAWGCTPVTGEETRFALTTNNISISETGQSLKVVLTEPVCMVDSEKTKETVVVHTAENNAPTTRQTIVGLITAILGIVGNIAF